MGPAQGGGEDGLHGQSHARTKRNSSLAQPSRSGVRSKLRSIAEFREPFAHGYLVLLEFTYMTVSGSHKEGERISGWAPKICFELVDRINLAASLPARPCIRGLQRGNLAGRAGRARCLGVQCIDHGGWAC